MLALYRPRCILHYSRCLQVRALTTLPRPIPLHVVTWNPTARSRTRQDQPSTEPTQTQGIIRKVAVTRPGQNDGDRKIRPKRLAVNKHRARYLRKLFEGPRFTSIDPTHPLRAAYLDLLFTTGKEKQALREWEADHSTIDILGHPKHKQEHFETGIKMHALVDNVERVGDLLQQTYERFPKVEVSISLTAFRAHTGSTDSRHHEAAYAIYGKMKELSARHMTSCDYDGCMVGFLEAGKLSYAQEVFRDMVNEGFIAQVVTPNEVREVLKRLHMLYRLGTDISAMTNIALDAIEVLPEAFYGRLFADWIKLAVVQNAPEAAGQVIDLMFRRGYVPHTYHFNLLLQALMRSKESLDVLRAENIGWRMIDETRRAHKREPKLSSSYTQTVPAGTSTLENLAASRQLPTADISTFSIIMDHHARNLQWEFVDYLTRQLKEIPLEPNVSIMNVMIDNKTRQGAYAEAWSIYKQLTDPPDDSSEGVFPNGASIRYVWKMLRLSLGDEEARHDPNLPSPREVLKETLEWWKICRGRPDAERFRIGLASANYGAISGLILHCFSYTMDLPGTLVALHVLRHKFSIFPSDKDANILHRQIAWVDMSGTSQNLRSQLHFSKETPRNLANISRVHQIIAQKRRERMGLSQAEFDALPADQIGDIRLNELSELTRVVMNRAYPKAMVEEMIDEVKRSIGCPDLPTGDMTAFEVA